MEEWYHTSIWEELFFVMLHIKGLRTPIRNIIRLQNQVNLFGSESVQCWLVVAAGGWCRVIDWFDATFLLENHVIALLQGLSLMADCSLRYLRKLCWINYLPAELWHFQGLYDRWETHMPSISLSPLSPCLPLILNLSFAEGKRGKKSWRMSQRTSPAKHFEGYLILTWGRFREKGLF